MIRIALSSFVAAAVVAVAFLVPAQASIPRLQGTTGPGFTVEVKMGGKDVKKLKAGMYTIKVADKSSIHNFHLFGPGLNKKTGVPFIGTQTWTIRLKPGKYTYQCDIHFASGMKGSFRVT